MIPDKAKAGDRVSAAFLNFCRDAAASTNPANRGVHDPGLGEQQKTVQPSDKCNFYPLAEADIQPNSVFKLADHTEYPYVKIVKASDGDKSGLYTNRNFSCQADSTAFIYPINKYDLYELLVDGTNPPAVGDFAEPKDNDWTLEKGGSSFLCLAAAGAEGIGLFLGLPSGGGALRVGFVVNNDLQVQSAGEVEQYEYNDLATGDVINVFNPHDVVFYKENTISGEEHPPDRVLILEVDKWDLPLVFPFMLSACEDLVPIFPPSDV